MFYHTKSKIRNKIHEIINSFILPMGQYMFLGTKKGIESFILVYRHAPWRNDQDFLKVYEKIKPYTFRLLDSWKKRLYGFQSPDDAGASIL